MDFMSEGTNYHRPFADAAARRLFDDSRIPCDARQYEPVSLTKTGILHSPVDVETDRIIPGPGSETGTFRIRADFHRVDRDLRRARDAAASGTMNFKDSSKKHDGTKKILSSNEIHNRTSKILICRV